jgi:hypothetical protein
MSSTSQRFLVLVLGAALNFGVLGIKSEQVNAQPTEYNFTTRYIRTTTNSQGFFSVNHGISAGSLRIFAINVAVQHENGNWHTLEVSNTVDNRFWWNSTLVAGRIGSSNFYDRPVRILLFTTS